ncbi:class II fructose-bisphosphate aldolase [Mammaliicoccus sciuri]|uniref:class II fructose-bisphosphate aldolase n=1 Tax=Mammaliicoccus sciuri TaxID=1296 RepID=UPI003B9F45EE
MKKHILEAFEKNYAIPQININGLIWIEGILKAAQENASPVIIATTDKNIPFLGGYEFILKTIKNKVKTMNISVPVIVHLDHGLSVEGCKKAVDAGYDSVMFDRSQLPIDENIKLTKEVVDYAHKHDVYVEGEVGAVGGSEDGMVSNLKYASVDDCVRLAKESFIDSLAPALGSVHGEYVGEPDLDFGKMQQINDILNIPLVLHGASGISDHDLDKAIKNGHAKINFNTEINIAWNKDLRQYLNNNPNDYSPQNILKSGIKTISTTAQSIMSKCSSINKVNI